MLATGGKPTADSYIQSIALSLRYINDQRLEEYDITNQQARLLGGLCRSIYDGVNINRKFLEDMMQLKGPSVTSLLNGLEKKGFIIRYTSKDDGRAMDIKVTEKGEQLLDMIRGVFDSTERKLLSGMTVAEQEQFMSLLHKAHDSLSQDKATDLAPIANA